MPKPKKSKVELKNKETIGFYAIKTQQIKKTKVQRVNQTAYCLTVSYLQ